MRGQERNASGSERKVPPLMRFSTESLPERERVSFYQDVMARTITGCNSSSLEGRDLRVDLDFLAGEDISLGRSYSSSLRNHRDKSCLSDQDDDFIFLSVLEGSGTVEHQGHRVSLSAGEGVLARFSHPLDTAWPDARLMVMRVSQKLLRGVDADRVTGLGHKASNSIMRLLHGYAQLAMEDGIINGGINPIAERHLGELVAGLCASNPDDAWRRSTKAASAARVATMREALHRNYANPCLTMRQVAARVGLSERAGHLAFQAAQLSFTEELQAIRLCHAGEFLRLGDARVIDVAFRVGFSDTSHFHRLFKRRFGCTPGEYRAATVSNPGVVPD